MGSICQLALIWLCTFGTTGFAAAPQPRLWGQLRPGSYAVGFKSLWRLDFSRRYNMTFDDKTTYAAGKAPRPILVNIWYPSNAAAGSKAMPHREYLAIQSADPQLAKLATELADYDRNVIAREMLGKPVKELSEREKVVLQEFLDTPTACIRDAPAAEGAFPLVIYHAGYGSSFEDNSVLCEFLASHGYVVLGSAYQEPSGSSFNVDGKLTSASDMQFLVGYASQLSNVDWNHIGVIGHSGGAHAALIYRAQNGCPADAIVSLDTTEDYFSVADPRWEPMTTPVTKNRSNMTGPLLMVANPHAFFQLADSLSSARRFYLTFKDLDHNDFISQGGIGRELRYRLRFPPALQAAPRELGAGEAEEKASLDAIRSAYESLCVYVLRFLDAELKGDEAGKEFLTKQYRDTNLAGSAPHVVYLPEGRTGPDAYPENSLLPPTPRQLRRVLHKLGSDKTIEMLRRFHQASPAEPIFHPVFGLALVGELLDQGKTQDAIAFHNFYREFGVDSGKMLLSWGEVFLRQNRKSLARDYFQKVLVLDPSSREAATQLKELGELENNTDGS